MMHGYIILFLSKHKRELLSGYAFPESLRLSPSSGGKQAILLFYELFYRSYNLKCLTVLRATRQRFLLLPTNSFPSLYFHSLYITAACFLSSHLPCLSDIFLIATFTSSLNKEVPLTKDVPIHNYEIVVFGHLVNFPRIISSFHSHFPVQILLLLSGFLFPTTFIHHFPGCFGKQAI